MHRIWGHDSLGTTTPTKTWYLAEGCTYGGVRPGPGAEPERQRGRCPAHLHDNFLDLLLDPAASLPPYSRKSFNVGDTVVGQLEV